MIETNKVRIRDVVAEALAGVTQRPGRTAMTAFGTVLGVAVLIIVLGLTSSAAAQISSRFDPIKASELTVAPAAQDVGSLLAAMPDDAPGRALRINGTRTAGLGYRLDGVRGELSRGPSAGIQIPVFAATAGFLEGIDVDMSSGVAFDAWHDTFASRVVMLGPQAARAIGYGSYTSGSVVWIDGVQMTVAGVIKDVAARPELLSAVVIPYGTARDLYPTPRTHQYIELRVTTDPGAANVVADQLPIALDPTGKLAFEIVRPPDIESLRDGITGDLNTLFLLLGGVCLIVGMVSIANTTFVAVIERTQEIGLRRALGARREHILSQFLIESTLLGALGGLIGSAVGMLSVVAICLIRDWTAVLDWRLGLAGPLLGALTGMLAGLAPAWRAARIEPIQSLRT